MRTVFIVEDDDLYRDLLARYFEMSFQFKVVGFSSGEECLQNLDQKPDIVILDYYLNMFNENAINGDEVYRRLKIDLPNAQVIFLSSQQNGETVLKMIKEGVRNYVIKDENTFDELEAILSEEEMA